MPKQRIIKINESIIKEALADYFNHHDANLELEAKDFTLLTSHYGTRVMATRKETEYEIEERE